MQPLTQGGTGFDTRYEGVKGSPRLFEKLVPGFVKINSREEYFKLEINLDVFQNRLLFSHPKTGKLLSLPSSSVNEIIINTDSIEGLYRTTANLKFEKDFKDVKFCQILYDGPYKLIKIPFKVFNEADYKKAYSVDRRYDEFETSINYYIMTSDNIFHSFRLSTKSLTKLFPDKKSLIEKIASGSPDKNDEEKIILILSKL